MGTDEAIRQLNATIGQWQAALKEGMVMDGSMTALLLSDLKSLQVPLSTLTDWLSDVL